MMAPKKNFRWMGSSALAAAMMVWATPSWAQAVPAPSQQPPGAPGVPPASPEPPLTSEQADNSAPDGSVATPKTNEIVVTGTSIRGVAAVGSWLDYRLKGDRAAGSWFDGTCASCTAGWTIEKRN